MRIRDSFGIYHVLEELIKQSPVAVTCVELYDHADVKKFADSVARVSDYLGHMYRRGLLGREPAPKTMNSQARWAYFWKNKAEAKAAQTAQIERLPARVEPSLPQPVDTSTPRVVLRKPNIDISDNGGTVVIDLPELTITIHSKS